MTYGVKFETTPRAAKQYRCDGFAAPEGCTIEPGDRYVRQAVAPWTLIQDDPDSAPFPIGEWWVRRFHARCANEGDW